MTELLLYVRDHGDFPGRYERAIRALDLPLTVRVTEDAREAGELAEGAEIIAAYGRHLDDPLLRRAKRLKWIHILASGTDFLLDVPWLPREVIVTSTTGMHGPPVSEMALLLMLALARRLPQSFRHQQAHEWSRIAGGLLFRKTVGILGVGTIALDLAPKCKAMGMTVIGISSAPRAAPGFDRMVARDDLARAAADVDFLVALTPLTDETRGIVGEAVFRAMRPGSFLVNLARGGVVDEASLAAALMERRIAGAALDVFQTEPLPQGHPFWDMANVIVTPHLGGYCDDYVTLAMPAFERNLRAFLAGRKQDMINLIERK